MKIFIYSFFISLILIACGGGSGTVDWTETPGTGSPQSAAPTGNISGQVELVESTN